MRNNRIKLEPNKPVTVTLLDPFADSSERFDPELGQCEYRTTDGRVLALPRPAAIELNQLDPQPGEEIGVCRKDGRISLWLTTTSEKARAAAETDQDAPQASDYYQGKRQFGKATPIRAEPVQERGTGTHGPAPAPQTVKQPASQPRPALAARTPYGDMLRHIIHTVEAVLKAEGVQLGDAPKQDLYTTVYIDAAKRCGVEYDFTRGQE